jgi:hypothetical protein
MDDKEDFQGISKSDRDGLIFLQIKNQEYAALLYHDSHYSVIRGFNRISVCEKCGTTKHSYEDTFKDKFKLFECITELKEYLVLDEYNKFVKQVETIKIYIRRFDRAMQYQKRRILLILDNFTGHHLAELDIPTNIELLFLPPNTTTILQPLDAGIIKKFKTHYR